MHQPLVPRPRATARSCCPGCACTRSGLPGDGEAAGRDAGRARHLQPGALPAGPGRGLRPGRGARRASCGSACSPPPQLDARRAGRSRCGRCSCMSRAADGALAAPARAAGPPRRRERLEPALRQAAKAFSDQDLRDLQVLSKLAWFDLDWQAHDPVVRALAQKGRGFDEEDKRRLRERELALLRSDPARVPPRRRRAAAGRARDVAVLPPDPAAPVRQRRAPRGASRRAAAAPLPPPRGRARPDRARPRPPRRRCSAAVPTASGRPRARSPTRCWSWRRAAACAGWRPTRASWSAAWASRCERRRPGRRCVPAGPRSTCPGCAAPRRGRAHPLPRPHAVRPDRLHLLALAAGGRRGRPAGSASARSGRRWAAARLPGAPVVPIILDGENAWEHFRDGGRVFLGDALPRPAGRPRARGRDGRARRWRSAPAREMPRVFAGSWINADFSVWIGHADDRRAWDAAGRRARRAGQPRRGAPRPLAPSTARGRPIARPAAATGAGGTETTARPRTTSTSTGCSGATSRWSTARSGSSRPLSAGVPHHHARGARPGSRAERRRHAHAGRGGRARGRMGARGTLSRPPGGLDGARASGHPGLALRQGRRVPAPARGDRGPGGLAAGGGRGPGRLWSASGAAVSSDGARRRNVGPVRAPPRGMASRTPRRARGRRGRRAGGRHPVVRVPGRADAAGCSRCRCGRRAWSWSGTPTARASRSAAARDRARKETGDERHRFRTEGEPGLPAAPGVRARRRTSGAWTPTGRMYQRSLNDPEGFWAEQAETLRLVAQVGPGARVEAAVREVVRRRDAQPLGELPRPPRRHLAAQQGGAHLGGRAGRGPHAHLPAAPARGLPLRERAQGAGRGEGRPRRHLHADDPRGRGRHAGLRAHRGHAQRGLRRLLGRGAARPHERRAGQGRHHRRRRLPAGRGGAAQGERGRGAGGRARRSRRVRGRAADGRSRRHARAGATTGGTSAWTARPPSARPSRSTPSTRSSSSTRAAPRASRRASCTPPAGYLLQARR